MMSSLVSLFGAVPLVTVIPGGAQHRTRNPHFIAVKTWIPVSGLWPAPE